MNQLNSILIAEVATMAKAAAAGEAVRRQGGKRVPSECATQTNNFHFKFLIPSLDCIVLESACIPRLPLTGPRGQQSFGLSLSTRKTTL